MEALDIFFPVSGVEVNLLVPPLVALVVSFFASLSGLSGAFLILPFMISGLGFAGPSASATNFVFNIVAIPSGVYNFTRQKRVLWPMVGIVTLGTLPGLALGYFIRVKYLPDPARFRIFVGAVLMYMALKVLMGLLGQTDQKGRTGQTGQTDQKGSGPVVEAGELATGHMGIKRVVFRLGEREYSFRTLPLLMFSVVVGVIGGAYGIGGGVLIVPFLVALEGLPIYAIAGGAILSTFLASVAGVGVYSLLPIGGVTAGPDWGLGLLFGLGGACGVYLGSRVQRHVPERTIRVILFFILSGIALKYLSGIMKLI